MAPGNRGGVLRLAHAEARVIAASRAKKRQLIRRKSRAHAGVAWPSITWVFRMMGTPPPVGAAAFDQRLL
jgi:hypothetical protein